MVVLATGDIIRFTGVAECPAALHCGVSGLRIFTLDTGFDAVKGELDLVDAGLEELDGAFLITGSLVVNFGGGRGWAEELRAGGVGC